MVKNPWLLPTSSTLWAVLGRPRGIRIGEAPDRDGQYSHYLGMCLFALDRLGRVKPAYRQKAVELARQIHPRFVLPGLGVYWKDAGRFKWPLPEQGKIFKIRSSD